MDDVKLALLELLAKITRLSFLPGKVTISELAFKLLNPKRSRVSMPVGDLQITVNLAEKLVRYIYFGAFEKAERRFIHSYVKPHDTAIDVGANYGYLSAEMLSAMQNQGTVYAFEPNPSVFEYLSTLEKSACGSFHPIQAAVSDSTSIGEEDMIDFYVDSSESMWSSAIPEIASPDCSRIFRIRSVTLSDFISDQAIPRIDFIKIDVEGLESSVLRGLYDHIKQNDRPTIMVEITDGNADNLLKSEEIIGKFQSLGYRLFEIDTRGELVNPSFERITSLSGTINLVLATNENLKLRLANLGA